MPSHAPLARFFVVKTYWDNHARWVADLPHLTWSNNNLSLLRARGLESLSQPGTSPHPLHASGVRHWRGSSKASWSHLRAPLHISLSRLRISSHDVDLYFYRCLLVHDHIWLHIASFLQRFCTFLAIVPGLQRVYKMGRPSSTNFHFVTIFSHFLNIILVVGGQHEASHSYFRGVSSCKCRTS